jgi:hypothetical protein
MPLHELDTLSLVAGLLAAAGGGIYLLDGHGMIEVDTRWGVALALFALALFALVGAVRAAGRGRHDPL